MTVLKLAGIGILLRMTFEDLRERKILLLWFIALAVIVMILGTQTTSLARWFKTSSINVMLGSTMIICAWLGTSVIRKGNLRKLGEVIGMGDILFIGILAFIFATHAYIAFLIMALGFSLVAHFIIKRLLSHKEHTVALAGWMALFLAVYWIGQMVGISIFNDFGAY